jgi:hypothetical protein
MNGLTASEQSYPRAACSAPAGPPPLIGRMLSPVWRRVHFLLAVSQHHHQSPLQVTSPPIPSHSFAACHTHSLLTIPELAAPSYFALSTISKPAALLSSLQSLPQSTSAVPLVPLVSLFNGLFSSVTAWASLCVSAVQSPPRRVARHFPQVSMTAFPLRKFQITVIPRFTVFGVFFC